MLVALFFLQYARASPMTEDWKVGELTQEANQILNLNSKLTLLNHRNICVKGPF